MNKILTIMLFVSIAFPALAADVDVTESHTAFDRDSVTLRPGNAIVFSNKDDITHDIHVVSEADDNADTNEDKGLQKPGQDLKVTFPHRGIYKVYCAINPNMKMTVNVQ